MIQDLVAEDANHVKRLLGSDGVDEHVAMDADEMLRVEYAVFVLEGSRCQAADRCSRPFWDN